MKREKNSKEVVNLFGALGLWYSMVIAKMGALSVCPFVLLNEVSKEHSCPSLSDRVMEVSGADGKWALDARCLCVLLSESPKREKVKGSLFRLAPGRTRTTSFLWGIGGPCVG